ncbi:MAG: SDR family oxidoreductase [Chloroflexi bacterium]|nr:SDR family oxidoreductase [Chloroflexota bacterium]
MERVVVTGGAGFIGSHLAEKIAELGFSVLIVDNLSTGKMANIDSLLRRPGAEFVQASITDLPALRKLLQGVSYVFHEAALARVPRSVADPLGTNETNITGTLNTLIAARENGVRKVIYAASSSAYGETSIMPLREDMPVNPISPYAVSKLTGEHYCDVFRRIYGLSTASLRYFNVYGPRQDAESQYSTVIPAFISRAQQDLPPVIHGDGGQSRDFTFIDDVVRANVLALENNAEGVFNIGAGRNTTVNQLAGMVLKAMGKSLKPVHEAPRPGDPRETLADISRARNFGWEPRWALEDGIRETVKKFPVASAA